MKMIVETTGPFMLMGSLMSGEDSVAHDRPCVVRATTYIQMKAAAGMVAILKQDLPDNASDGDFLEFFNESKGDKDLAIESYLSSLAPKKAAKKVADPEPQPVEE